MQHDEEQSPWETVSLDGDDIAIMITMIMMMFRKGGDSDEVSANDCALYLQHGPRKRAGTRTKAPVKAVKKKTYCAQGAEFRTQQFNSPPPVTSNGPPVQNGEVKETKVSNYMANSADLSPAKGGSPAVKRQSRRYTGHNIQKPMSAPPPPPVLAPNKGAPDAVSGSDDYFPPPPMEAHAHAVLPGVPAPPPPPPPPPLPGQGPKPAGNARVADAAMRGQQQESQSVKSLTASESSASVQSETPLPPDDGRSDLLAAIRRGMELRKVQVQEAKKERKEEDNDMDVASILARRIAVEYSSSEDESETGSEWDDDED